jgi:hemolysin D
MHRDVYELSDCSEFRQTLQGRPPAVVHGTAVLLMLLLAAALAWAALVKANLVVQAPGRVRPVDQPARVFTAAAGEIEGRVAEVNFNEGDAVSRGQMLVRLDTERLDNEIAKLRRQITAAQGELAELTRLDKLLRQQFASAQSKARAELKQAEEQLRRSEAEQTSRIRQAEAEMQAATDRLARYAKLHRQQALSEDRLLDAQTEHQQAKEKVQQARLPLDRDRVEVLRRAVQVVNDDFRLAELEVKRVAKQGEIEAAGKQLDNLLLARSQAVLRAPIDGVVVSGPIDVGDVLEPGRPVVEIAQQDGFRFEAALPSGDVGDLQVGMPVNVKFDAYDYQKYGTLAGTVCFISPDSRLAEGDKTQPSANRPIAYVVRVQLRGDAVGRGEMRGQVKLGLGGTAEIVTGQESILAIFLKKIRRTISLG